MQIEKKLNFPAKCTAVTFSFSFRILSIIPKPTLFGLPPDFPRKYDYPQLNYQPGCLHRKLAENSRRKSGKKFKIHFSIQWRRIVFFTPWW